MSDTSNITNFTVEDPCDVVDQCQTARALVSFCDENLWDEMQAGCELDTCVVDNDDITAIDDAFMDDVVSVCKSDKYRSWVIGMYPRWW